MVRPDQQPHFKGIVLAVAVAASLMGIAARPAETAPVTDCASVDRASLDARLAEKADHGVRPFVGFVRRVDVIYRIDVEEALQRVARYRAAVAECATASNVSRAPS